MNLDWVSISFPDYFDGTYRTNIDTKLYSQDSGACSTPAPGAHQMFDTKQYQRILAVFGCEIGDLSDLVPEYFSAYLKMR